VHVWMKKVLTLAVVAEVATGLALLVVPSLVGQLLLGTELNGVSIPVARVAGIALLSLGLACWPSIESTRSAWSAILTYNLLVALYLLYLGIWGKWVGVLLWPAAVLHAVLTTLLARVWPKALLGKGGNNKVSE
jgi:hypothetical protein